MLATFLLRAAFMMEQSHGGIRVLGFKKGLSFAVMFAMLAVLCGQVRSAQTVSVAWDANQDTTTVGYYLNYGVASGVYTNQTDVGTNTSATVSGLQNGVTYYFAATAYNSAGVAGPPSNEAKYVVSTNPTPSLAPVSSISLNVLDRLVITNKASDTAPKQLTFSLDPGTPAGMRINPATGVLFWMPLVSAAGTTNTVTVRVTDNSVPPVSATQTFSVVVSNAAQLNFSANAAVAAGQTGSIQVGAFSSVGVTNMSFTLDGPTNNQISSLTVLSLAPQTVSVSQQPPGSLHSVVTIQALGGQVIPIQQPFLQINATAKANQHSSFVFVNASSVAATQADGNPVPKALGGTGRFAVVGSEPLVDAQTSTNGQRTLVLFGPVGSNYVVQSKSNLSAATWSSLSSGTLTNLVQAFANVSSGNPAILYRAYTH